MANTNTAPYCSSSVKTMRSIARGFRAISDANPNLSSFLCFAQAVKGRYYKRRAIQKAFFALVEKDDYDAADRNRLIRYLCRLAAEPQHVPPQKDPRIGITEAEITQSMNVPSPSLCVAQRQNNAQNVSSTGSFAKDYTAIEGVIYQKV